MALLLGIDTGGTYTDAVLFDEDAGIQSTAKSLTTRHDLSIGISGAIDGALQQSALDPTNISLVSLSTTLATNALVEGQGGAACLIFIGFKEADAQKAGLGEALGDDPLLVLSGGHDALGNAVEDLDLQTLRDALPALAQKVSAFAIAGKFGVRNPAHELAVRDLIHAETGLPVTCSHELSSKLNGPKRALTSLLNARLISMIHRLISSAENLLKERGIDAPLMVVQGDGALISADVAALKPIETILSGPAASLVGASYLTGEKDALVSDIGGTTTDVAVLSDGLPRLDENGARVGGWQTMVEAVAMHTVGLGGDSQVHVVREGLTPSIALGPRRVVPLTLLASNHPDLVRDTLERQLRAERPGDYDGQFVFRVHKDENQTTGRATDDALLEKIGDTPIALDKLIENRRDMSVLNRLVSRGLVLMSGLTPTDAAHILGLYEAWDVEIARLGASLFGRKRNAYGDGISKDPEHMASWIVDTLISETADTLLDVAFREDGYEIPDLARHDLARAALARRSGLVNLTLSMTQPVIGLGASAGLYYNQVAERLSTSAIVPEHAGVANALGAVVGRVQVRLDTMISEPMEGRFRLHHGDTPRDFANLDLAIETAEATLKAEAYDKAVEAGAQDVTVKLDKNVKRVNIDGKEILVECTLIATASGRPRITR
ncbi:hydantoinase/oxoprolinase family protein [Coralliovum pocilloporae]|uniref:hydantoinase/oxoprolinase family protein n=1 Tax=Coralliovum pocilloporae TaxID=3066369 RepID=UPI0033077E6B